MKANACPNSPQPTNCRGRLVPIPICANVSWLCRCLTYYQCAIPCFEGLLPVHHNRRLIKLLYRLAEWHALAKLRMHRSCTLELLDSLTQEFGDLIRQFRDKTGSDFRTVELPREAAARRRLQSSNQRTNTERVGSANPDPSNRQRVKTLNLSTVKLHFMGDYVAHIRHFGTTDSYSTQLVCMQFYYLYNG